MYLIQYSEHKFVDAESIRFLDPKGDTVFFTLDPTRQEIFIAVEDKFRKSFLNQLESINKNIISNVSAKKMDSSTI